MDSISQLPSQDTKGSATIPKFSQTASDFIDSQLKLEADAQEALPFRFDRCTQPDGAIRQNIFACLTCNPPPESATENFQAAGICYSCSIVCHGEHTLVEIFARRNFTCECGTTKYPANSPCNLAHDPSGVRTRSVHSRAIIEGNTYNQNFRNRFCSCGEWYDAHNQKGTMYQCLGLETEANGGCGEDWYHPECLMGLPRDWHAKKDTGEPENPDKGKAAVGDDPAVQQDTGDDDVADEEHPVPPGFPDENGFDTLICYKCVQAAPWIKRYAGSEQFFALAHKESSGEPASAEKDSSSALLTTTKDESKPSEEAPSLPVPAKRKAEDDASDDASSKKLKLEDGDTEPQPKRKCATLPPAPTGSFSLFAKDENFRDYFCRCPECYLLLRKYPQLLEVEEIYQPPLSEDGEGGAGEGSVGTGSLLERGEAALSNVDRVRAIEGVMVYNHLKDKVKSFLQPFAESGQAVGAEDIKAYFEKLRGDSEAIKAAGGGAAAVMRGSGEDADGDNRREESGY